MVDIFWLLRNLRRNIEYIVFDIETLSYQRNFPDDILDIMEKACTFIDIRYIPRDLRPITLKENYEMASALCNFMEVNECIFANVDVEGFRGFIEEISEDVNRFIAHLN